jgi:excisionase family DNA binding protein
MSYSIEQAREQLGGVARSTVYQWIDSGKLGSVKVGGRRLIGRHHIQKFLAEHEAEVVSA